MVRNLLWDLDGTLIDTQPAVTFAISRSLSEMGFSVALNVVDGLVRQGSLDSCVETLAARYRFSPDDLRRRSAEIYREIPFEKQLTFSGVREVCAWVQANGGLNIILTGRPLVVARVMLAAHDLSALFADILSADQGYPCKPDPAIVNAAIEKHSLCLSETMLIGHRESDILAGQAAGVLTCLSGAAQINPSPDLHIMSYAALLDYLKG